MGWGWDMPEPAGSTAEAAGSTAATAGAGGAARGGGAAGAGGVGWGGRLRLAGRLRLLRSMGMGRPRVGFVLCDAAAVLLHPMVGRHSLLLCGQHLLSLERRGESV